MKQVIREKKSKHTSRKNNHENSSSRNESKRKSNDYPLRTRSERYARRNNNYSQEQSEEDTSNTQEEHNYSPARKRRKTSKKYIQNEKPYNLFSVDKEKNDLILKINLDEIWKQSDSYAKEQFSKLDCFKQFRYKKNKKKIRM